jgi:hypothetical protein
LAEGKSKKKRSSEAAPICCRAQTGRCAPAPRPLLKVSNGHFFLLIRIPHEPTLSPKARPPSPSCRCFVVDRGGVRLSIPCPVLCPFGIPGKLDSLSFLLGALHVATARLSLRRNTTSIIPRKGRSIQFPPRRTIPQRKGLQFPPPALFLEFI